MAENLEAGRIVTAEADLAERLSLDPTDGSGWYDLACLRARAGRTRAALGALERSLHAGHLDPIRPRNDPDLEALRSHPAFLDWLRRVEAAAASTPAVIVFAAGDLADRPERIRDELAQWRVEWSRVFGRLGPSERAWAADRRRLVWGAMSWDRVAASAETQEEREVALLEAIRLLAEGGVGVHPQLAPAILARSERFLLESHDLGRREEVRFLQVHARHLDRSERARAEEDAQAAARASRGYLEDLLVFAATADGPRLNETLALLIDWAASEGRSETREELRRRLAGRFQSPEELADFADRSGLERDLFEPRSELPPFELEDLTGQTWKAHDLPGRANLIVFWATWCGPCRAELPGLRTALETYAQRGLRLLSVSVDRDLDSTQVGAWAAAQGMNWPVAHVREGLDGEVPSLFGISRLPSAWLTDGKGRILESGGALRGEALARTLELIVGAEEVSPGSLDRP